MGTELKEKYLMLIDGEPAEGGGGEVYTVYNPARNEPLTTVALGTTDDVDRAVAAARKALKGDWRKAGPAARSRMILNLADLLRANADELARLETMNVGKAISSTKGEVYAAADELEFFASHTRLTGETLPISGSMFAYTMEEPVGVCAAIVPWNYPLMLTAWKLAPVLATGCTVVVKTASATPLTGLRLAELCLEAGIPPGVVNVITGSGSTVGAHLASHPGVDKVSFTGATDTGAEIMRLASDGIKRVTLELGGKSPNIVFADADLDAAAAASAWAIYYSAGQSCEARSRLFLQQDIYDEFLELFVDKARKIKVGDPLDPATQVGSLISEDQLKTVDGYVQLGVEEGAKLLTGGGRPDDPDLAGGAFYLPTVLEGVRNDMRVAQEEIFGPVVTAIPFKDEAEAVAMANDVIYGLAATVFTGSGARAQRVARSIQSGTVSINSPFIAFPGVPFGGFKQSGVGRERARQTVDQYTETRTIVMSTSDRIFNPFRL